MRRSRPFVAPWLLALLAMPALLALLALLAGCAQTRMDAQWSAPDLAPGALRGARVIVQCQAPSETEARVCADALAAQLGARGLDPRVGEPILQGAKPDVQQIAGAAQSAGARAAVVTTLTVGSIAAQPPASISIGFGGGSWGGGGSYGALGGSVALPVGSGTVSQGLSASTTVTWAATARPLWSGLASNPPQGTPAQQIGELARTMVDAMQSAALF
jgi:hypothetical protein